LVCSVTLLLAEIQEQALPQAVEAGALGADPEIAFAVFVEALNFVVAKGRIMRGKRGELALVESVDPSAQGAGPQDSAVVYVHIIYYVV
jgi:hypothetical protein